MKYVTWVDDNGYKRRSMIRDTDPDSMASAGIPAGPPDLTQLDWPELIRELNNILVDREINTWEDVQNSQAQSAITQAVVSVFRRPIVGLYRQADKKD